MKCPHCTADTMVFDTRAKVGGQWRRRVCTGPERHTFSTSEVPKSALDELLQAKCATDTKLERKRARQRVWVRQKRALDPDVRHRELRRADARKEAAETGEQVETIYSRWGVA